MPERATEDAIIKSNDARQVLDNPMLIKAFDAVDKALDELWLKSGPGDEPTRTQIHAERRALRSVKSMLGKYLDDGLVSAHNEMLKKTNGGVPA